MEMNDSITRTINFEDLYVGALVHDDFYSCIGVVTEIATNLIGTLQPYARVQWFGENGDYCEPVVRSHDCIDCIELLSETKEKE